MRTVAAAERRRHSRVLLRLPLLLVVFIRNGELLWAENFGLTPLGSDI